MQSVSTLLITMVNYRISLFKDHFGFRAGTCTAKIGQRYVKRFKLKRSHFKDQVGYFSSQSKLLLYMNLLLQLLSIQEVVIGFVIILVFDMF